MTTLIFIRHGYSTNNASGCYTGQLDAPLNELGVAQAVQLADYLCANLRIDAAYASDLSRAVETLRPTAERLGLVLHTDPALRELDVGKWTGVPYAKVAELYPADFANYKKDVNAPCTGGESTADACRRIWDAVERILQREEGKTVAICSHALACRLLACLADGANITRIMAYPAPANASLSIYDYNSENGKLSARVEDFTEHLKTITRMSHTKLV